MTNIMKMCIRCNKKAAGIWLPEQGDFCPSCMVQVVDEILAQKPKYIIPQSLSNVGIYDFTGTLRIFSLSVDEWNNQYTILAKENSGWNRYLIDVPTRRLQPGDIIVLLQQAIDGMTTRTLQNSGWEEKRQILRRKGQMRIDIRSAEDIGFIIDGKRYSPEELGRFFLGHGGEILQYTLRSPSAPPMREDTYLAHVSITRDKQMMELMHAIKGYAEDSIIPRKNEDSFEECLDIILSDLQLQYESEYKEDSVLTGKHMILWLMRYKSEDPIFLAAQIEKIGLLIDPSEDDEELWRMIAEWENQ